jgi:hypothetical protein
MDAPNLLLNTVGLRRFREDDLAQLPRAPRRRTGVAGIRSRRAAKPGPVP